jgi:hypothetical protein
MTDPITMAINRQLSQQDRRLLPDHNEITESWRPVELVFGDQDKKMISDGGFNARIIEQALDLKYL